MPRKPAPTLTEAALITTTKRKIYCNECTGLFASKSSKGVVTFYWKFTDPDLPKGTNQLTHAIGRYCAQTLDVEKAQTEARRLYKDLNERGIKPVRPDRAAAPDETRLTVADIVARYVAHISAEVEKTVLTDGVPYVYTEPRLASWTKTRNFLLRFTKVFGRRAAATLEPTEIARFLSTIESDSSCNRLRAALCACFKWCCQTKQSFLTLNPMRSMEEEWRPERSDEDTQRALKLHEVAAVWQALRDDRCPGSTTADGLCC